MAFWYVGGAAAGSGNGSSRANKALWTNLDSVIAGATPGDTIRFIAEDTYFTTTGTAALDLSHGGTLGSPITITSVDINDVFAYSTISSNRAAGSSFVGGASPTAGSIIFKYETGASNLIIEGLWFKNCGYSNLVNATVSNMTWRKLRGDNIRSLVRATGPGNILTGTFQNIIVIGHSKQLLQIVGDAGSTQLLFEDIYADSQYQDGDAFAATITLGGNSAATANQHVQIRRVTGKNCIGRGANGGVADASFYWQGDGITTEEFDSDILIENCAFSGMGDGGLDMKSVRTTLRNVEVRDCKIGFRRHAGSVDDPFVLERCRVYYPNLRGGIGSPNFLQGGGNMQAIDCTFVDDSSTATVAFLASHESSTNNQRTMNVTSFSRTSSMVTVNTSGSHKFASYDALTVTAVDAAINGGPYTMYDAPTNQSLRFYLSGTDIGSTVVGSGTIKNGPVARDGGIYIKGGSIKLKTAATLSQTDNSNCIVDIDPWTTVTLV